MIINHDWIKHFLNNQCSLNSWMNDSNESVVLRESNQCSTTKCSPIPERMTIWLGSFYWIKHIPNNQCSSIPELITLMSQLFWVNQTNTAQPDTTRTNDKKSVIF